MRPALTSTGEKEKKEKKEEKEKKEKKKEKEGKGWLEIRAWYIFKAVSSSQIKRIKEERLGGEKEIGWMEVGQAWWSGIRGRMRGDFEGSSAR